MSDFAAGTRFPDRTGTGAATGKPRPRAVRPRAYRETEIR
jgi:hypothetical protein